MLLLRVRTKDGTERIQAAADGTLTTLRQQIEQQLGVPVGQQALARSDRTGRAKGAAFEPAEDAQPLSALGLANGDMLFLDYQIERENQAKYVEKDPFVTIVQEGELRQQGKTQWTLTDFTDYRATKEFVLGAPPEPHAKFVQIDQRATAGLMNYMIMIGFGCKRVGWLYGRWVEDPATGEVGAQVHAIYEPSQDCTPDDLLVNADAEAEEKLAKLCAMLNLVRVGVIIAHPAREYPFSVNELIYASKLASQAREAAPEEGKRFVLMKARPVLESEKDIEGVATVEAYQLTDQCIELVEREAFSEAKTDPRVAKTAKDCCFLVEKKEQRKATVEHFVARVFDIGRQIPSGTGFTSFLGSGFPIENRPTETQDGQAMASYLRSRKSQGETFLRTVSNLHFLLFLSNFIDMSTEMPVLCSTIVEERGNDLDGFQMMINCYAGLE